MNEQRAAWALHAIKAFQEATGTDDEDAISDLVCDLGHLSDRMSKRYGDFERQVERGISAYNDEIAKDGGWKNEPHSAHIVMDGGCAEGSVS